MVELMMIPTPWFQSLLPYSSVLYYIIIIVLYYIRYIFLLPIRMWLDGEMENFDLYQFLQQWWGNFSKLAAS